MPAFTVHGTVNSKSAPLWVWSRTPSAQPAARRWASAESATTAASKSATAIVAAWIFAIGFFLETDYEAQVDTLSPEVGVIELEGRLRGTLKTGRGVFGIRGALGRVDVPADLIAGPGDVAC